MNSYQKRLQTIKYLEQCVKELEQRCFCLADRLPRPLLLPLSESGMDGSDFITPYNNGEFTHTLLTKFQK